MIRKKGSRLREPYRLLLLRDDTLAEVGSYRLSLLNIYIAVSALLIVTSALVFALIFLTPLRRLVPGYANVYESREYRELNNQVRALEQEMVDQRLYLERFRSLLAGVPMPDSAISQRDEDLISSVLAGPVQLFTPPTGQPPEPRIALNPGNERYGTQFLSVVPPLRGTVSAGYDPYASHLGTDILAPQNTPVVAILDGTVLFADWTLEAGNTIGIQHEGNMVSVYKHNSRNLKKEGARVKAGEAVAIIGNTGEATSGPHLHFELWIDGRPVDPQLFVNF
jgi:murein DD-endopeptidase MepM/ murein hydrolase activator NlpD